MRDSGGVIDDATYQDVAVGYEPLFTDRPVQLRHPLVPAHRIISNTADGSIISNVLDMSAYARLFLARGDVPGHDGQRMLSEESFDAWIEQRVSDDEGGTYGYGLWSEDVRRGHVDRALRRDGRLHGAVRGLAGRRARVHRAAERLRRRAPAARALGVRVRARGAGG